MGLAKTTVTLYDLVNSGVPLFDFEYDMWDNTKKSKIEEQFINNYMFHEIGFISIALFKHYLKTSWTNIMPYYNQLYKTTILEYNPLNNYKMVEELEGLSTSLGTNNNKSNGESTDRNSDKPNGKDIMNDEYVTNVDRSNSSVTGSSDSHNTGTTSNKRTAEGNIGVTAIQDLIQKERKLILNFEKKFIDDRELKELFMGVL